MSAVLRDKRLLLPMTVRQLDAVQSIEQSAYAFPWTRGNFIDSLAAGYPSQVLYGPHGELLGYFIAMGGVDEMHLLNITVAPAAQHQGHARFMLDELRLLCNEHRAKQLWLEVRESNLRARAIYERYGFTQISLRRAYYPASRSTHANSREDAVVMSLKIEGVHHALE